LEPENVSKNPPSISILNGFQYALDEGLGKEIIPSVNHAKDTK
jgi:hypothetical protein